MFRQDCLRQIYEMFVEHVIKNPLYQLGDELDNCTARVSKRAKLVALGFTDTLRYGNQIWLGNQAFIDGFPRNLGILDILAEDF